MTTDWDKVFEDFETAVDPKQVDDILNELVPETQAVEVVERNLGGRPRVNLNQYERSQIWESFVSGLDAAQINHLYGKEFKTNLDAIERVIEEYQHTLDTRTAGLERIVLIEHVRRMIGSLTERLHESRAQLVRLEKAISIIELEASGEIPSAASLNQTDFDKFIALIKARQAEIAGVAKLADSIQKYTQQLISLTGALKAVKVEPKKVQQDELLSDITIEDLQNLSGYSFE